MDSFNGTRGFPGWVSPFRYPRIHGYLLLPAAFRSLSRLSSALSAKASPLCSSSLDHSPAYLLSPGRRIAFRLLVFGSLPLQHLCGRRGALFLGLPYISLYTASDVSIFSASQLPYPLQGYFRFLSFWNRYFSVFGFQGTNSAGLRFSSAQWA